MTDTIFKAPKSPEEWQTAYVCGHCGQPRRVTLKELEMYSSFASEGGIRWLTQGVFYTVCDCRQAETIDVPMRFRKLFEEMLCRKL